MVSPLVKAALGCYYPTVRSVYIPQVAFIDISIGKELTSPGFHQYFYTGIHRATLPENPVLDCNVVFSPLSESVHSDQIYSMAVAIADQKELPGMNLEYFDRNLEWNYLAWPKLLDLPSGDELDLLEQQLQVSILVTLDFIDSLDFVDFVEIPFELSYT